MGQALSALEAAASLERATSTLWRRSAYDLYRATNDQPSIWDVEQMIAVSAVLEPRKPEGE
jgi:hypothetical protein